MRDNDAVWVIVILWVVIIVAALLAALGVIPL